MPWIDLRNTRITRILKTRARNSAWQILLGGVLAATMQSANATPFSETFDADTGVTSSFTSNLGGIEFTYTFTADGDGGDMAWESQYGESNSASINLQSASPSGATERVTIARTDGGDFTFNSLYVNNTAGATVTVAGYRDGAPVGSGQTVNNGASGTLTFASLRVDEVRITSTELLNTNIDSFAGDTSPPADNDGSLSAAGNVAEPAALPTTADTVGEAVEIFDFTLADGGTSDGQPMTISQIVLNVSGTSSDTVRGNIVWRLNGSDISNVQGVYNAGADTITFSGLSVSIADGDTTGEIYTVNAYFNDNTGLTEGDTVILSVDGSNDVTTGSSGTKMASGQSAVTNGSGSVIDVTATRLSFATQPAGSTSGSALTTQPVVAAADAFGNTDDDFSGNVTLTEASAGSLSGTTVLAASGGAAGFTDVAYTATADQQSFTLTASAAGLSAGTANPLTSDVVATKLLFDTQPSPTTIDSGSSTSFTTVPVVQAVDANNTLDTGYGTDIVLSVTDPNDGTLDGTVDSLSVTSADQDGSGTTVTLTPASGSADFTGLALQYTNAGASDSIALRAESGGLTAVNSTTLTALINDAPVLGNLDGDAVAWAGIGNAVVLDAGGDAAASDTERDALNGGNGDYAGGSLTLQRSGGAVTSDMFGFDTSGALFTVSGSSLQSGGQTFATFTNANGVLTINFDSSQTTATSALVSDAARRITYRNDTPAGDARVRLTLSDGAKMTTADITVTSDRVYITETADTAVIDATDGTSVSEAVAVAAADGTGMQTLVMAGSLAGATVSATALTSLTESLTLDMDAASGVTLSGGTLTLGGGATLTLFNGSGDSAAIGTVFSGTGALVKTGPGSATLTGTQVYSGATTLSGGTLSVAGDSNLGSGHLVLNGGTLSVTGSGTIDNAVQLSAAGTLEHSGNLTLSGLLSGSQPLTVGGSGEIAFSNTGNEAASSSDLIVSSGVLWSNDDNALPSGTITLNGGVFASNGLAGTSTTIDNSLVLGAGGGTVDVYGGGGAYTLILSGTVSGTGNLLKTSAAVLTLAGTNTYTGTTTIQGGQLTVAGDANLGSGAIALNNGTLTVTGSGITIDNSLSLPGGGTLSAANDIAWSGVIAGTGTLTKAGAGTLTLSGMQTHSGATVVAGGAVSIAGDGNIGAGTLTLDGGELTLSGPATIDNAISLGAGHGTISNTAAVTLSGVISGSGNLTKSGAGTLTLSGTNTYSGSTALSAGVFTVSGSLPGSVTAVSGTVLDGTGSIGGLVSIGSGATLRIGGGPGVLTLGDGLMLNSGSTLVARIDGTSAGSQYDQYRVTGPVTLAGTLSVTGSHSGGSGDTFLILDNDATDAVNGSFDGLAEGDKSTMLNAKPLTVSYAGGNGNDVTLAAVGPAVTDGNITISGATGSGGVYKIGDTVTVAWDNTAATGDNNATISGVTVDFSAFGGGAALSAGNSGNTWTAAYTLVAGALDGVNLNVAVTATDGAGLSTTTADTGNAAVDVQAPAVSSGNVSLSGASGTGGVFIVGDTVTATWNNTLGGDNNADISSVEMDLSDFGGAATVAAVNGSDTWTGTYTVVAGTIDAANLKVSVTVSDDAGNFVTAAGGSAAADNQAPVFTSGSVATVAENVSAAYSAAAGGDGAAFALTGGADMALFAVDAATGAVTFAAAPDFENPADADADNVYEIEISATDNAGNSTAQAVSLSVRDINEEVDSGLIDDFQSNGGLLRNPIITETGIVEGGVLAGEIDSEGLIRDVTLAAGARVQGGRVAGSIVGDSLAPALINAVIEREAHLNNVVIGLEAVLSDTLSLGPNVSFESPHNIPAGLGLSDLLEALPWENEPSSVTALNLGRSVFGANGRTLLRSIQLLQEYEPSGAQVGQDFETGELIFDLGDSRAALVPVEVAGAGASAAPGTRINEDGDVVIVTEYGLQVLNYPAPNDTNALRSALQAHNGRLQLGFDERANIIVRRRGGLDEEAQSPVSYRGRPDVVALPAPAGARPGLRFHPLSEPANVSGASLVYEDGNGDLFEQQLAPFPADWFALKARLQAIPGVRDVRIDTAGIVSLRIGGLAYRGRAGYKVLEAPGGSARGSTLLDAAGDLNGDGRHDFLMTFPGGESQILYILP